MPGEREGLRYDALVLALVVVANLAQNLVVPEPAQLVTGPMFAAAAVWIALRSGLTVPSLGLSRASVRAGLRWGLLAVALVAAALAVAMLVPASRTHLVDASAGSQSVAHVLYEAFVRVPVATAGPEEVIFRGVVLAMAVRRLGPAAGALFAAALFGLWHVLPILSNESLVGSGTSAAGAVGITAAVVLATFVAALVFTWLRRRSDSIVAPFLAHWATNGLAILAIYLVSR